MPAITIVIIEGQRWNYRSCHGSNSPTTNPLTQPKQRDFESSFHFISAKHQHQRGAFFFIFFSGRRTDSIERSVEGGLCYHGALAGAGAEVPGRGSIMRVCDTGVFFFRGWICKRLGYPLTYSFISHIFVLFLETLIGLDGWGEGWVCAY